MGLASLVCTPIIDRPFRPSDAGRPARLMRRPRETLDESDERSFNSGMGRIAGVTATEAREGLLRAAADVFAERGYDGARVADIAAAAGVSNGAMYAHFASKADLMVDALRTHGRRQLSDLLAADPDRSVTDLLLVIGRWLPRRRDPPGYLLVEALVAARPDEQAARPMRDYFAQRPCWPAP